MTEVLKVEETDENEKVEEEKPEAKTEPKRRTFSDVLREAAARVDEASVDESDGEVHNVGKIITLLQGKRVFSEEKTIAPGITVKLGNLTARHKSFISSVCYDEKKLDKDGNPSYNEQLSLDLSMAFMWSELNGIEIKDPLGSESGVKKIGELWDELSDRTNTFNNWPPSWFNNFVNVAREFTQTLLDTCSEDNVKAF